jgi:hypothetical protein
METPSARNFNLNLEVEPPLAENANPSHLISRAVQIGDRGLPAHGRFFSQCSGIGGPSESANESPQRQMPPVSRRL